MKPIALLVVLLCLPMAPLGAQAPARPFRFTVFASPGVGSVGPSLIGAVAVAHPWGELAVRVVAMNESGVEQPRTAEKWRDVALLYGFRDAQRDGWIGGSLGPAVVFGVRQGTEAFCTPDFSFCGYQNVSFRELALAAQLDLVWVATDYLGLGVNMYGNVNGKAPFGGGGVSLHLGQVR